ncbi:hypothetical protein SAMN05216571_106150 [Onishia taeanensis]|uniref:Uncharacterized protein n=1 Tax=Onishia taeanensis TaxID=284577 RepID=A0A1G7SI28_9GAMM|nr:hypothetical protein [Halomonas taeanensis]SDG22079.1 hypothetical protein SAMN05216571_106150 [Halomonas taeanensis]
MNLTWLSNVLESVLSVKKSFIGAVGLAIFWLVWFFGVGKGVDSLPVFLLVMILLFHAVCCSALIVHFTGWLIDVVGGLLKERGENRREEYKQNECLREFGDQLPHLPERQQRILLSFVGRDYLRFPYSSVDLQALSRNGFVVWVRDLGNGSGLYKICANIFPIVKQFGFEREKENIEGFFKKHERSFFLFWSLFFDEDIGFGVEESGSRMPLEVHMAGEFLVERGALECSIEDGIEVYCFNENSDFYHFVVDKHDGKEPVREVVRLSQKWIEGSRASGGSNLFKPL